MFFLGSKEVSYADREDVHKPATNISEKKTTDKVQSSSSSLFFINNCCYCDIIDQMYINGKARPYC